MRVVNADQWVRVRGDEEMAWLVRTLKLHKRELLELCIEFSDRHVWRSTSPSLVELRNGAQSDAVAHQQNRQTERQKAKSPAKKLG